MGLVLLWLGMLFFGLIAGVCFYSEYVDDEDGMIFGFIIFGVLAFMCGVGIFAPDDVPQETPKVKIVKCYEIENTNQEACKIELPNGETDVLVRKVEAEDYIDEKLIQQETLRMILGV